MKTPCLKCGLIHDEPTAICDGYAGMDIKDDVAAQNRKKAVERIRAVLASVPVEARSGGRARAAAAGASTNAALGAGSHSSLPAPASISAISGPMRPAIVGSGIAELPPAPQEVPEWRREVTERLESYRSRRERQRASNNQSVLAFRVHSKSGTLEAEPETEADAAADVTAPVTDPATPAATAQGPESASAAEVERVYAPMEENSAELHSEQTFAAAVDEVADEAAPATAAIGENPAVSALPIPEEPALVLADATTLEVHADAKELAEVQTVEPVAAGSVQSDAISGMKLEPGSALEEDSASAPVVDVLATIPHIDAEYWRAQPSVAAVTESNVQAGADSEDVECGTLTSGFDSAVSHSEEPVVEHAGTIAEPAFADPPMDEEQSTEEEEQVTEETVAIEEPVMAASAVAATAGDTLFAEPAEVGGIDMEETEVDRRRVALRTAARPQAPAQPERIEISVPQPVFDFAPSNLEMQQPQDEGLPVADLRERRCAAALDAAILAFTLAGFFVAFHVAGGEIAFSRAGMAIGVVTSFLIYAVYMVLFTMLGGGTPGMTLRGLRVVCFDGSAPEQTDLVWRGFGYLLSAAAGTLGFVWSAWDEHGLTWHDRISQTYITYADPAPAEATATAS